MQTNARGYMEPSEYENAGAFYSDSDEDSDDLDGWDDGEYEPRDPSHNQASYPLSRYRPGGPLQPIHTGETLQIGPMSRNSPVISSNAIRILPPTIREGPLDDQSDYIPPSHTSSDEDESDEDKDINYINPFQSSSNTYAYATGRSPASMQQTPRARSPTPGVDEEDYYVEGDSSVHYTGLEGQHSEGRVAEWTEFSSDNTTRLRHDNTRDSASYASSELTDTADKRHFGPVPSGRINRRHNLKKVVPLTNGNFVFDMPVPSSLVLPRQGTTETTHTRYTLVTCDPDEFENNGYFLRQTQIGRRTEMFIVITMYNEDEILFCRTLYGVMQNISHLCARKNSATWGPNAWKKVVVCIVADGRSKIHPRVLDCLTLLGVFQPNLMKSEIQNTDQGSTFKATAHLFEYTTTFGLDANLHFRYPEKGVVPTQILLCIKETNQRKINSHRWFFNAFAPLLQPNVCILLDVGTRPDPKSLYHLWKTFDLNSNVAGACGEIAVDKGKNWSGLLNPLVAAQNFEYKMSGILDKPTESLFGFISVLPGAFSAYRYIALQNDVNGIGPLASYFKGEAMAGRDTDIFTSNMYLAEDRILCFELVAKANSDWVLRYVKGAVGETDVPSSLSEFVSQRRRWLNGSFFAATYAIAHVGQLMRSGHSTGRKAALLFETIYNVINMTFAWFSIANFFIFFIVLSSSLEDKALRLPGINILNATLQYVMGALVIACFLFSMGNKPQTAKWKYMSAAIAFSVLMVYLMFASVRVAIAAAQQGGAANSIMVFSVIVTYGLYGFSSLLAMDPWHMFTSFAQYVILSPIYIMILNIYAFSNLDDISWGTKQDAIVDSDLTPVTKNRFSHHVDVELVAHVEVNEAYNIATENLRDRKPVEGNTQPFVSEQQKEQIAKIYYANVRTNVLLTWVLSNGVLIMAILGNAGASPALMESNTITRAKGYLIFILVFTALSSATIYWIYTIFALEIYKRRIDSRSKVLDDEALY